MRICRNHRDLQQHLVKIGTDAWKVCCGPYLHHERSWERESGGRIRRHADGVAAQLIDVDGLVGGGMREYGRGCDQQEWRWRQQNPRTSLDQR